MKKAELVEVAFESRALPVLVLDQPEGQVPELQDEVPLEPTIHYVTEAEFTCSEKASDILADDSWVEAFKKVFVLEGSELDAVDLDMKNRADYLQKLLLQRLKSHIVKRVKETQRESSRWIFQFVASNAARLSAVMTIQGHVIEDLEYLDQSDCLLSGRENFVRCDAPAAVDREGGYLYRDRNRNWFLRSGKVVGRSFLERDKEHKAGARRGTGSKFYELYPSKELGNAPRAKGTFEKLEQLVALGFKGEFASDEYIRVAFPIDDTVRRKIAGLKFGAHTADEMPLPIKMRHMISYLVELAYDLALSPSCNVSESPGFEACGLFG